MRKCFDCLLVGDSLAVVMHGSNALLGKIIVRNTDFSNSSTAILSLSADYCEIYSNNVNVNQNANSDYASGIYLQSTSNFYVEGNTVTGVSYASSFPDNTYGIIVNSSGENNNTIYRNMGYLIVSRKALSLRDELSSRSNGI